MDTATNPTTGERVVRIGDAWKPFSQSATGPKGTKAYFVDGAWISDSDTKSLVDQIPDTPAPADARRPQSPGLLDRLVGIPEASAAIGTGMITGAVAPIVGAARTLFSGKYGTPEGVRLGADAAHSVVSSAYQPRSQTGQALTNAAGEVFNAMIPATPALTAAAPLAGPATGQAVRGAANAMRSEVDLARQPVRPVAPDLAASRAAQPTIAAVTDLEQATKLDAIKTARELKAVLHPIEANPERSSTASSIAGTKGIKAVAKANAELPTRTVKADHGLAPGDQLTTKVLDQLKADAAAPYEPVRKMADFPNVEGATAQLEALRRDPLFGKSDSNARTIDAAVLDLEAGMKGVNEVAGERVLRSISEYRAAANKVFANPMASPEQITNAKLDLKLAGVLETLIEDNVGPKELQAVRDARAKLAKIYADESVIDPKTGKVDPDKLASLAAENPEYSGDAARLGKVIGQFPRSFGSTVINPETIPLTMARIGGPVGAILHTGSRIANIALGNKMAQRLTTPEYQNRMAPPDRRGMLGQLNSQPSFGALPPSTPGVPVPYDFANAVGRGVPNWVPGRGEVTPEVPQVPPNRLAAPTAEATMENVARQRAGEAQSARFRDIEAERAAAGQEAAGRVPAGRGQVYDLDPVTGRLKAADQGLRGATPDIISDTGAPLASAVEKIANGQAFALDALEKIAWDRTLVDLATVEPGIAKLTHNQIIAKWINRNWAEGATKKLRDQAEGFAEIARRAEDYEMKRQAMIRREQMMDLADVIEDQLRRAPTVKVGQGPKTRAARRNAMSPDNRNALGE